MVDPAGDFALLQLPNAEMTRAAHVRSPSNDESRSLLVMLGRSTRTTRNSAPATLPVAPPAQSNGGKQPDGQQQQQQKCLA